MAALTRPSTAEFAQDTGPYGDSIQPQHGQKAVLFQPVQQSELPETIASEV